jgi:hypothetical protein
VCQPAHWPAGGYYFADVILHTLFVPFY